MPSRPGRSRTQPADPAEVATTTSWRAAGSATSGTSGTDRVPTGTSPTTGSVTLAPALGGDSARQAVRVRLPRRPRAMERRALFVAGALLVGVFASAAVARSISDVFAMRAQVATARAANEAIRAELEASRAESSFAGSPVYLRFAARSLGYGSGKEQPFALRDDAAPAPSIVPLGGADQPGDGADVLDGLVELLFSP